jgi:hypothetical protein
VFAGPLAGGRPMRLDLVARDGKRKWEGYADGEMMRQGLSERGVLRLVRGVLRAPRTVRCGVEQEQWRGVARRAMKGCAA